MEVSVFVHSLSTKIWMTELSGEGVAGMLEDLVLHIVGTMWFQYDSAHARNIL